ncbi:uncharacterized protein LOC114717116 isoform X2 [Neltuma alba]|uniref:uncharacterized protein LOC114717116 isoform X2 n=1 Tax=Neltuma alba TaxID=207710 RepID=UPI0010A3A3DD|nr:uncharacterized protein LOC114717116 isoform X2 [Prosopis alba]
MHKKQSQMKNIPLILMGCGGVGRHLLQHIITTRSLHSRKGLYLRVVGICDSQCLVVTPDLLNKDLDDSFLSKACQVKQDGSSLSILGDFDKCQVYGHLESRGKILEIASQLGLICVDCSASSDTVVVLKEVVHMGCCAVLANKKPLTSTMEDFEKLFAYPHRIRHESTVGAGLPVIVSLNRIISSGDTIYRIVGSLSGTLGYVMSEVEDGKPLSKVVRDAKALGYTEPDPRDDLSGMDVARKALILARILGKQINLDDIKIESLYPKELGPDVMSIEDFMDHGISRVDGYMQERVMKAAANEKVLRYVCVIEGPRCEVGILEIPKNSALGRLRGSDNILEISTRCYKEQPLVIQGAGAGNDTTAAGVLADIIDLHSLFH